MVELTIKENTVQAFHKRLQSLVATENPRVKGYALAQRILRQKAEMASKKAKIVREEWKKERLDTFFSTRPRKSWSWYIELADKIKSYD